MKTALSAMATAGYREILVEKLFAQGLACRNPWQMAAGSAGCMNRGRGLGAVQRPPAALLYRRRKRKTETEKEPERERETP